MRSLEDMLDYAIVTSDGLLGSLHDAYYDDRFWTLRYLVVGDIGEEAATRVVSTIAVAGINDADRAITLNIDRATLMSAPDFGDVRPVSVRMEAEYFNYFGWPHYWPGPYGWGTTWASPAAPAPAPQPGAGEPPAVSQSEDTHRPSDEEVEADQDRESGAPHHLRSARETIGYHLEALDGGIGHVEDFVIDPKTWRITVVLVDTSNWWLGKKVLVPSEHFTKVEWDTRHIFVDETREEIKGRREVDEDEMKS